MDNLLDSKTFGLNSRVVLQKISDNTIAIVKKRKTRIIMKDANQILEQANNIKKTNPKLKVVLIVSGPVCSKTIKLLSDNNIEVITQ
jgi:hypothetical protein